MYEIYMIEQGDTIDIIADKAGTSVDKLREINKRINIVPGEYIIIPANDNEYFDMYTVLQGDNPYKVAQEFGISVNDLMLLNGLNENDYIYPDQQLIVPRPGFSIYITKDGDTVDTLVKGFNADYDTILRENNRLMLTPEQLVILRK